MQPAVVNGDRIAVLVAELDARYARHRATEHLNDFPNYNFVFVKDREAYGLLNDCNQLTCRNLRELGCTVDGVPILSNFVVRPPGKFVPDPGTSEAAVSGRNRRRKRPRLKMRVTAIAFFTSGH